MAGGHPAGQGAAGRLVGQRDGELIFVFFNNNKKKSLQREVDMFENCTFWYRVGFLHKFLVMKHL